MSTVNLSINGLPVSVEAGTTILDAAKTVGIKIPSLCYLHLPDVDVVCKSSSCRVCLVEIEGRRNLAPSCSTTVVEGMIVKADTARAVDARKTMLELMLSNHPHNCLFCKRRESCELKALSAEMGIDELPFQAPVPEADLDTSNFSIIRDTSKCILCRRCETVCTEVQTMGIYSGVNRGFDTRIDTAFHTPMMSTACTFCGQCVAICPTAALTEVDNTPAVFKALRDPKKTVIVQTAPAVRVALGEELGYPVGTNVTGKMVTALRRLGFDKVVDTDFTADLTIIEEATELIHRIQNNGVLPMMTSCCPAWIKFLEHKFPHLLPHLSTCKSPHEMLGAVIKAFYAEKLNVKLDDLIVVSVMPCLAKKYENNRPELSDGKYPDVDIVISTRELGAMIKHSGLQFKSLPDADFDRPFGESSGASVIFGTTGGVMEAALRTAYETLTGRTLDHVEFEEVRGFEGIRSGSVMIGDLEVKVAIAHTLRNARKLMEEVENGTADYHFIEVMACPGGCIGGGGQPYHHGEMDTLRKRAAALYSADEAKVIRRSHENPDITRLYQDFLGEPNGHLAHELLHTHYVKRSKH